MEKKYEKKVLGKEITKTFILNTYGATPPQ